ncbi:M23 family metallopeptidase [Natranaerobius thermophilus]|uniref:Peptidase M23 n=1 Tax=Natranaerobius thermophilus (strain ATCC BAA-1301 / DSM 18059 / JW/NM-WN-LF) TaxID=457570 RepID=B2A464_NATTJ|nr:M23 family metallopeptidase [Natranaerobius thermophilus]ACB86470.1 Peptidase M23 [Natranaerobius thermophilus JW/NM-WN-LF]
MRKTKPRSNTFTIMLIPHSEKSSFSIKLPIYVFQGLAFVLVLSVVLVINMVGNYMSMTDKATEAVELREENRKQQEKIDKFAQKIESFEDEMKQIAKTEQRVREILDMEEVEGDSLLAQEGGNESQSEKKILSSGQDLDDKAFQASSTAEQAGYTIRKLAGQLPDKQIDMEELKEAAVEKEEERMHTPSKPPVNGRITSGFGTRSNPLTGRREFHEGVDIAASHGTPVRAPANGQVVYRSYRGGYGNLIIIDHGYGYTTYYAHLSDFNVSRGEQVESGDIIGYVGNTGNSTAPHLHYEVHVNNSPENPREYMTE